MKPVHIKVLWHRLRESLWLVPSLLTLAAFAAAEVTVRVDAAIHDQLKLGQPGIYSGSAAGARQVLGTLAGSMVSLTTISFSVMMVVLTLASNQFGPRVLRNFLADRLNQVVLGTFVATFVYCVVVLGRVPDPQEVGTIPRISVTIALALTLVSLGMLIVFIHHVARSIQASEVVRAAYVTAEKCLDALYPDPLGEDPPVAAALPADFEHRARPLRARAQGYIQAVDAEALLAFARKHAALVRLKVAPGDFINLGDAVAEVISRGTLPKEIDQQVERWLVLGPERSPEQDPRFALRQLGEIGVRSLSTGLNDPHTVVDCIDRIGALLARLARRQFPPEARADETGEIRAWLVRADLPKIAEEALNPLRNYGCSHPIVVRRLIHLIGVLNARLTRARDMEWLRLYATQLRSTLRQLNDEHDRRVLTEALDAAIRERSDPPLIQAANESDDASA